MDSVLTKKFVRGNRGHSSSARNSTHPTLNLRLVLQTVYFTKFYPFISISTTGTKKLSRVHVEMKRVENLNLIFYFVVNFMRLG